MKFRDISLAVIIVIVFVFLYFMSVLLIGIKKIKNNWPEYKCNPMVMPFASVFDHDPVTNFIGCVSGMQKGIMGFFLQPLKYTSFLTGKLGGILMNALQEARYLMNYIRKRLSSITGDIFGVFLNILIQFQRLLIAMKTLVGKLFATMMVMVYLIVGSMRLGTSIWKGPIGGILRTLCFKGDTKIKMKGRRNSENISDISLGDILENGSVVIGLLKLKGSKVNPYYKIWSDDLNDYIYVTGEHRILNRDDEGKEADDEFENFIKVNEFKKAEKTEEYDETLYCLITDDHRIPVGEYTFWDWED